MPTDGGAPEDRDDRRDELASAPVDGVVGSEAPGAPDTTDARRRDALADRFRARAGGGHRHLLTGSTVLVVGAAVQGLGGVAFSLVVAQWDTKADFGNASALFTSVLFVTYLAGLGLPVALARYAADRSIDSHVIFTWAIGATAVASVAASGLYLGVVHPKAARVLWDWHPILGFVLFAAVVMGSAFSLIVDVRAMTMRRWNLVLIRIVLVGVAKVALLPIGRTSDHRAVLLFVFLGGPVAISGFVGIGLVNRITGGRHRMAPRPGTARPAIRYSLINYLSTLAYQAPYFALPVIVLVHVPAATNSSFYVAWGIVAIAFYVPSAIGQALLAEGGKEGAAVRQQVRLAMGLAVALMGAGAVVTFLAKGIVVAAYGESYRDSARILPAMMAAGIPWAISSLYLTEARVLHRHVSTVIITITLTAAIIVPALVLVPGSGKGHGLDGASTAWLVGNIAAALVAAAVTWVGRRHDRTATSARLGLDPLVTARA
ncbi:MAG: lipopolysaccharide biosynthesis protein [Acidimicrobiales bacterium]